MEFTIAILIGIIILLDVRISQLMQENQILTDLNKAKSEQLDMQDELIKKMLEDDNRND